MQSRTAEVNGTRIHYVDHGAGQPILLLHGFTLDWRMWSRQIAALGRDHRVIAFDARGFGESDLPGTEPYLHCEDAAALCEHLDLGRVVAVGHSIGGHQMLELAVSRPDRVAAYVSVCTSGLVGIPYPEEVMEMFKAIRLAARTEGLDAAKRIWSRSEWIGLAHEDPAVSGEMDAMLRDYSGWHWTHANPAKNLVPPAAERLADIAMPVLVVTGARDLPYNETIARTLAETIPGAKRLALGGTHMVNMEEPDAVNAGIAEIAVRAR
jgi:pimeloyl-ACP methyl ester carboxylesterase